MNMSFIRLLKRIHRSPRESFILVGCALLTSGCGKDEGPAAPPPPAVQVITVSATDLPIRTEFIGQLDSPQNVEVRARVEAFVEKILFTEGTEVKEGDPLFALDRKPFEERLAAAEGSLAEAKAALNKYEKDVARLEPLAEKRAIPRQDLDNALASVDVGKANVLSAQARVESAKLDLGYCDVRAPISGLIGATEVSVGEVVGKGLPTLLATMSRLDPIWFYCNISEVQYLRSANVATTSGRDLEEIPVSLFLGDGTEHPDKGKIVFIDRAVDAKTGTLRVRVEFPNSKQILRPGMFARIRIEAGMRPESILVPARAVTELQGKNFVWVVDQENKVSQRSVSVGDGHGSDVLVTEGLKAGERIIVEGVQKVRQGAVVNPQAAGQSAAAKE